MHRSILILFTFGMILTSQSVWSDQRHHGGHHGSMMQDNQSGYCGKRHSMGGHGKHRGPGNAAMKFLHLSDFLQLTANQVKKLKNMRDQYIKDHAADKQNLKAARMDLREMIHDDSVSAKQIEPQLKKIGSLEGKLWRAHIKQIKTIQGMLTAEQKARLKSKHKRMHPHRQNHHHRSGA